MQIHKENVTTSSSQFTLNKRDILRGLLIAVLSPVFTVLLSSLEAGSLVFNWTQIGVVALTAALSYILKNFLSPAQVVIEDPKAAKAIKQGGATAEVVTNSSKN